MNMPGACSVMGASEHGFAVGKDDVNPGQDLRSILRGSDNGSLMDNALLSEFLVGTPTVCLDRRGGLEVLQSDLADPLFLHFRDDGHVDEHRGAAFTHFDRENHFGLFGCTAASLSRDVALSKVRQPPDRPSPQAPPSL